MGKKEKLPGLVWRGVEGLPTAVLVYYYYYILLCISYGALLYINSNRVVDTSIVI